MPAQLLQLTGGLLQRAVCSMPSTCPQQMWVTVGGGMTSRRISGGVRQTGEQDVCKTVRAPPFCPLLLHFTPTLCVISLSDLRTSRNYICVFFSFVNCNCSTMYWSARVCGPLSFHYRTVGIWSSPLPPPPPPLPPIHKLPSQSLYPLKHS